MEKGWTEQVGILQSVKGKCCMNFFLFMLFVVDACYYLKKVVHIYANGVMVAEKWRDLCVSFLCGVNSTA